MLDIKNMSCKYDRVIFSNVNIFNIQPCINFIIGRSGCGKTSLIKSIIGLNDYSTGSIYFNGEKIKDYQKFREEYISIVFQEDKLIPYYTIKENLLMVSDDIVEIKHMLNSLHLLSKIDDYPNTLSGGQRQRINIIRACLKKSYINIFDEPTSSVNEELKDEIMNLIKELFKDRIVIIISHNMRLVNKYADRIIDIENNVDKEINKAENSKVSRTRFRPPLLKLNFLSYKNRNILPLFVISFIYIIVLVTLSLFDGVDRYIDYNLQKKLDYDYFYIINGENNDLSNNDIRYLLNNKFEIKEIIDYRSLIITKYFDKILFNNDVLADYYEVHIYNGDDPILINTKMYDVVRTDKIKFLDVEYNIRIINDGEMYTSPNIYFDYKFLRNKFGDITSQNYAFTTSEYNEVYEYLNDNYDNIYTLNDKSTIKFDNSTILINESLKPLLSSVHSLIMLLSYSVIIMSISFIKTLVDYNIKLRNEEINIYKYFGLKNINLIPIYESVLLTVLPLFICCILFNYLVTLFNKMSIYLLNEYFPMIKFSLNLLLFMFLLVFIINIVIFCGYRFNKNKQKL